MKTTEISFNNSAGHKLFGILRDPETGKVPAIIVCHGFGQRVTDPFIFDFSNTISTYGYLVLRFDFHGHGESEGETEDIHITQMIDDIKCAIDFLETMSNVDKDKIILFGHDLGGDAAILLAAKDKRIKGLILSGVNPRLDDFLRSYFQPHDIAHAKKTGFVLHSFGRLHKHFFEHMEKHDVLEELKKFDGEVLLIHGMADFRVTYMEARQIMGAAKNIEFEFIDGADHFFRQPEQRSMFFERVADWMFRKFR